MDEIERIVLTHYHEDHQGLAETIRRAGAKLEVLAHAEETLLIENWSPRRQENLSGLRELFAEYGVPEQELSILTAQARGRMSQLPLSEPTRVDRVVQDGDRVEFKDLELEVVHSPGHTPGHILLHEPKSRVLFTGDHIMGGAVPYTENFVVEGPPDLADPLSRSPRFKGLVQYLASLRLQRRMVLSALLPAHGGVLRSPSRSIMDARLFYDVRIHRIERGLRNLETMGQEVTGWELSRALFRNAKSDPERDLKTRMLTVIGALDVLEAAGKCLTTRRLDGVLVHVYSGGG